MGDMPEQFYNQMSENIKMVFDLTSRIDERVKMLVEQHNDSSQKIEKLVERQEGIVSRVSVLETKSDQGIKEELLDTKKELKEVQVKVAALEIHSSSHENKWKVAADFLFKLIVAAVGAILAWKMTAIK